jgi:hypothetical protein
LINTSIEPTRLEENERLQMLDSLFLDQVAGSHHFNTVSIAPNLREQIANGPILLPATVAKVITVKKLAQIWSLGAPSRR